jgi:hypothetical protein
MLIYSDQKLFDGVMKYAWSSFMVTHDRIVCERDEIINRVTHDIAATLSEDSDEYRDAMWQHMPKKSAGLNLVIEDEEMMRRMIEFVVHRLKSEEQLSDSDSNQMAVDDDEEDENEQFESWWTDIDDAHKETLKRLISRDSTLPSYTTLSGRHPSLTNTMWHKQRMLPIGTWSLHTGKLLYNFDLRPGRETWYRRWIEKRFPKKWRSFLSHKPSTESGTFHCSAMHTKKAIQNWNKGAVLKPTKNLPSLSGMGDHKILMFARGEVDDVLMTY